MRIIDVDGGGGGGGSFDAVVRAAIVAAAMVLGGAAVGWYTCDRRNAKLARDLRAAVEREAARTRAEREGRIRHQIALASALARTRQLHESAGDDHKDDDDDDKDAPSQSPRAVEQRAEEEATNRLVADLDVEPRRKKRQTKRPPSLQVPLAVIGTVRSCYTTRNGTPRQPSLATDARALLKLRPEVPSVTLDGLDRFSHCWVIFLFHQNTNAHKTQFKGTVVPPRYGQPLGVFATRTPHRPAPVGLSLARIVSVDVNEGTVVFSGLDLVDGTPVFDLKPYVPFSDCPDPRICQADESSSSSSSTPSPSAETRPFFAPWWVAKEVKDGGEPLAVSDVVMEAGADETLASAWRSACAAGPGAAALLYPGAESFARFVRQTLSLDIRSARERKEARFAQYRVTLCGVVVYYKMAPVSASEEDEAAGGGGGGESDDVSKRGGLVVMITGAEVEGSGTNQPLNTTIVLQ
ncbi:TsaA-like domain-containing protein [Zopfochytrium polystomum]|nr:TsaA-like domain-containing protein [Zopfochytrium polystomum]